MQIGGHSKNDGTKNLKIRVTECVNGIIAQRGFDALSSTVKILSCFEFLFLAVGYYSRLFILCIRKQHHSIKTLKELIFYKH